MEFFHGKNRTAYERTEMMLLINFQHLMIVAILLLNTDKRHYSYFAKNSDGIAHDLAFEDVLNSFNYFIENFNNDKPFIIMAHSQGLSMLKTYI